MEAPIIYIPGFLHKQHATAAQTALWNELDWVRHDKVPRREYYVNDAQVPYTYGTPPHDRTYQPQPVHPWIRALQLTVEMDLYRQHVPAGRMEVCFLNGYEDQSDQLGWHSDNSPEMDDARPIVIISLGVEREIHFREIGNNSNVDGVQKLKLQHGSMCIMLPGMQDTHQHRIPKAGFQCGERISLTFRGYVK